MKLCSAVLLVAVCLSAFAQQQRGTIFVVRHAERQPSAPPGTPDDPQLTDIGRRRAECLSRTLRDSGITILITSGVTRTNQTAEPLAAALHLDIRKIPSITETASTAREAAASGNVLIVGHSNTVPEIVKGLSGATVTVPDDMYDQLFVITEGKPASMVTVHYCPAEK